MIVSHFLYFNYFNFQNVIFTIGSNIKFNYTLLNADLLHCRLIRLRKDMWK
jgi:hypothetical protein